MKKGLNLLLVFSIVFVLFGNVAALTYEQNDDLTLKQVQIDDYQTAISILEKYVVRAIDETFIIQAPPDLINRISKTVMNEILVGMQTVNQIILNQNLVTTDNLVVLIPQTFKSMSINMLASGGVDKLVLRWYGWDLYLSHATIITINNLGVHCITFVIAVLVMMVPGIGNFGGLVAATLGIVWGIVNHVNQGNGVIVHMTPNFQLLWISSQ